MKSRSACQLHSLGACEVMPQHVHIVMMLSVADGTLNAETCTLDAHLLVVLLQHSSNKQLLIFVKQDACKCPT